MRHRLGRQSLWICFARGPMGAGVGKGQEKGGAGKGKKTRDCHMCGKKSHIARNCWSAAKAKGNGCGVPVGHKSRAADGRWYAKKRQCEFWGLLGT